MYSLTSTIYDLFKCSNTLFDREEIKSDIEGRMQDIAVNELSMGSTRRRRTTVVGDASEIASNNAMASNARMEEETAVITSVAAGAIASKAESPSNHETGVAVVEGSASATIVTSSSSVRATANPSVRTSRASRGRCAVPAEGVSGMPSTATPASPSNRETGVAVVEGSASATIVTSSSSVRATANPSVRTSRASRGRRAVPAEGVSGMPSTATPASPSNHETGVAVVEGSASATIVTSSSSVRATANPSVRTSRASRGRCAVPAEGVSGMPSTATPASPSNHETGVAVVEGSASATIVTSSSSVRATANPSVRTSRASRGRCAVPAEGVSGMPSTATPASPSNHETGVAVVEGSASATIVTSSSSVRATANPSVRTSRASRGRCAVPAEGVSGMPSTATPASPSNHETGVAVVEGSASATIVTSSSSVRATANPSVRTSRASRGRCAVPAEGVSGMPSTATPASPSNHETGVAVVEGSASATIVTSSSSVRATANPSVRTSRASRGRCAVPAEGVSGMPSTATPASPSNHETGVAVVEGSASATIVTSSSSVRATANPSVRTSRASRGRRAVPAEGVSGMPSTATPASPSNHETGVAVVEGSASATIVTSSSSVRATANPSVRTSRASRGRCAVPAEGVSGMPSTATPASPSVRTSQASRGRLAVSAKGGSEEARHGGSDSIEPDEFGIVWEGPVAAVPDSDPRPTKRKRASSEVPVTGKKKRMLTQARTVVIGTSVTAESTSLPVASAVRTERIASPLPLPHQKHARVPATAENDVGSPPSSHGVETPLHDEPEVDASSDSESMSDSEKEDVVPGWRLQGYEDPGDVNFGGDRAVYIALDSEASDEDYDPSDASDADSVTCMGEISDEEVADLLEGAGMDINDDDELLKTAKDRDIIKSWEKKGWNQEYPTRSPEGDYPGLYDGQWGPSPEVQSLAENPLLLFLFFFPRHLFHVMATETNRYAANTVSVRARGIHDRQKKEAVLKKRSKETIETKKQIRKRLKANFKQFTPVEFANFFGLCIARMLCPHKRRLSAHWSLSAKGAVPAGTFNAFMSKNRFDELVQHMHFSNNNDPLAKTDRVWKIRPIIDALQDSFKRGYRVGPYISFDEGMLPSQSKFNSTRMYMKDKPHKWGTKMFLTCCSSTAYCLRLEIYCGKKAHLGGPNTIDDKSGPSAVIRNIEKVVPRRRSAYHVVVMDRFYTSVSLLVELLGRRIYGVGTVQTRRIGFPDVLKDKRKKRPKDTPRGSSSCTRLRSVPELVAVRWWDSRPVFLLGTGSSLEERTIVRRSWVEDENQNVPCPKIVLDYHKHMGGVDVHDQLRLQRYSVQLAFRFKKYYKSLALGLLDCALVNAYIVHKEVFKREDKTPLSHAEFLTTLHQQLLDVRPSDLRVEENEISSGVSLPTESEEVVRASTAARVLHVQTETQDFQPVVEGQPRKRMARACKVCSYLAPKNTRGKNTKYFCPACSTEHTGDVYLCTLVRHESFGVPKPCFQIWHDDWLCGKRLPDGDKQLKFRPPTGKKRKPRQHRLSPSQTSTENISTTAS